MIDLPKAGQMKEADRYTIEELNIPSLTLMERAAEACVSSMESEHMDFHHTCIVCGSGNNGGDGFAIGRILRKKGRRVTVVFAGNPDHCTSECSTQRKWYEEAGGVVRDEYCEDEYSIIVDAIFGVGLSRCVEGKYESLIAGLNKAKAKKVAVDIPSGISADSGSVLGIAFRADVTVTFQAEKLGLILDPGREYAGRVCVADIGICTKMWRDDLEAAYTKDENEYARMLPERKQDSNKGSYGKLLVIAGSRGMSGAAYFNAGAAYRTGAGLVQIYTPEENRVILQQMLPEAIIKTYEFYDEGELMRLLAWADTICIGSGIGTSDRSKKILKTVMENALVPVIIDADGLNLLGENRRYFDRMQHKNYILTPHMKEMSRLTGKTVADLKERRMELLKTFTEKYGLTCVLKDSRTVVQTKGQRPYVNRSGNAAMAKAGSGDVLAGMIAGLVCQGMDCADAAVLGTYLHGRSGDFAREEKGSYSVVAQDLMDHISRAFKEEEQKHVEDI